MRNWRAQAYVRTTLGWAAQEAQGAAMMHGNVEHRSNADCSPHPAVVTASTAAKEHTVHLFHATQPSTRQAANGGRGEMSAGLACESMKQQRGPGGATAAAQCEVEDGRHNAMQRVAVPGSAERHRAQ